MAFIENTAFLPRMWNNRNEDLQNIAGQFGAVSDGAWATADCSAGFLCNKGDHIVGGGYKMTVAADGTADVYACNSGDVQRISAPNGNVWAVGFDTLGLGAHSGELCTFSKIVEGETYAFGDGNFSTLVSTTNKYATIVNGLLVGSSTAPEEGTGIYFELDAALGIDVFTVGNHVGMNRYNLIAKKI